MNIQTALRGDLRAWNGLTGQETVEALQNALKPVRHIRKPEERERLTQRCTVIGYERAAPPPLVEAWFVFGTSTALVLEYDQPLVQDLEGLLHRGGKPDLLLPSPRYVGGAIVKEYVYARHGITLSIAEPMDKRAKSPRKAVHIQLYHSVSAQYYLTDIGVGPELRPYPRF
jgi:hypothetical protein